MHIADLGDHALEGLRRTLVGLLLVCTTWATAAEPLPADAERALKAADSFKECDACPEMVVVPAGAFAMGSPAKEDGRNPNEGPQHRVAFARPFAVGRFAVTFDEWDACVADGGCNNYLPDDDGWGRGRRPAINVSWDDAKAYVAWLSRKSGRAYRLLSEAEREYVARAGTTTPFWWGASISTNEANYDGTYTYGNGPKGEYRRRTVEVDAFAPNPWGLYQVHGNVWEWTEDCWIDSYQGAPANGAAWIRDPCGFRVVRGGSWGNVPWFLRAAVRFQSYPQHRYGEAGFRVARTLAP
ncbi:MAG TPA: formylglycine-generating enzyme family protein [Xanthobacteraceae bacterium]|nr:formylglycine-generating enzyme family protein [Xanthobacteraceae bacterium]